MRSGHHFITTQSRHWPLISLCCTVAVTYPHFVTMVWICWLLDTTFLGVLMPTGQQRAAEGIGQGGDAVDEAGAASKVTTTLKGSMGERITKALLKVEEKKKKRAIRKAMVGLKHC